MEWIIWVIVIVLIIAVVWWLLNRNSGNTAAAQDSARTDQVTSPASTGTQADVTASERPQAGGAAASAAAASAAAATTGMATGAGRTTEPDAGPAAAEAPARQSSAAAQTEPEDLEPDIESWDAATPRPSAEEQAVGTPGTAPTGQAPSAAATDTWESPSSAPGHSPAGGDVDDWDDDEDKAEWDAQWSEAGTSTATAATGTGDTSAAAPPAPAAQTTTPTHHAEYTEPHAPTLPGAESAAAEAFDAEAETLQRIASSAATEAAASHEAEPSGQEARGPGGAADLDQEPVLGGEPGQPYGEGSAAAAADGSGPDGYVVKGDVSSMTYYDEDSSGYAEARAEVWFLTAAHAEAAGFRAPRRSRR